MKPWVKVLIVMFIVVLVIQLIKHTTGSDDDDDYVTPSNDETYIQYLPDLFDTVPPAQQQQPFQVQQPPLIVNNALTATPVLTQVASDLPAVAPTMVPTFVPTTVLPAAVVQGFREDVAPAVVSAPLSMTPSGVVTAEPSVALSTSQPSVALIPSVSPSMVTVSPTW